MMAFSFRELTNLLNKGKRLPEVAKPEAPLDPASFLLQLPIWGLCVKELCLLAREWRYSPATGSARFARKSFGHVAWPSCRPSPKGAGAVYLNHHCRDLAKSIGACFASPPTPSSPMG